MISPTFPMFLATHATVGAMIGRAVPNPILAFILAFFSHFLMDMIPHGDSHVYDDYTKGKRVRMAVSYTVIDAVITAYLIVGISQARLFDNGMAVAAGIIGGLLPDLLIGVYEITKTRFLTSFHRFHFFMHNLVVNRKWVTKNGDFSFLAGVSYQLVILVILQMRI